MFSTGPGTTRDGLIRIAAAADLHVTAGTADRGPWFVGLASRADLLLLAGDLTDDGTIEQAETLCRRVLRELGVPAVAVLGSHDHDSGLGAEVTAAIGREGVAVLDGDALVLEVRGARVGVAGVPGNGGDDAQRLASALASVRDADLVISLTHLAPGESTLLGERRDLYPWLGTPELASAVDGAHVDLAVHGHAHFGVECGQTRGGVPVRNVALRVLNRPYAVYELEPGGRPSEGAVAPGVATAAEI